MNTGYITYLLLVLSIQPYFSAEPIPLCVAARTGNVPAVVHYLASKGSADIQDHYGNTPLHYAAQHNYLTIMEHLIAHNAPIDARNSDLNTPLHMATGNGHPAAMDLLIRNGCLVNAINRYGSTPLHHAAMIGNLKAIRLLIASGALINYTLPGRHRDKPIDRAIYHNHVSTVCALLNAGAIPPRVVTSINPRIRHLLTLAHIGARYEIAQEDARNNGPKASLPNGHH